MSTSSVGRTREYQVRDALVASGWTFIMRAAASKGPADLVMAHPTHGVALIQVGSKSKTLGPADRSRLLDAAYLCSALPILAIVVPRGGISWWVVTAGTASTWERWER